METLDFSPIYEFGRLRLDSCPVQRPRGGPTGTTHREIIRSLSRAGADAVTISTRFGCAHEVQRPQGHVRASPTSGTIQFAVQRGLRGGRLKKRKSKTRSVISVASREANLKRRLRKHLAALGFKSKDGRLHVADSGKEAIRSLHHAQRNERLNKSRDFIDSSWPKLAKHFAAGSEVDPQKIEPELELIEAGTWQSDLFRLASLTWAVPVSNGFGRRLRYLVRDRQNSKLIGLIAIGDPVFNLTARDNAIKWNVRQRGSRLVNIMDAYVLGAVPPYNMLLGGKLVASLVRTRDLYDDFLRAYGNTRGIISKRKKHARLLIVTTSSSLGRSSIYNRLKLDTVQYFKPIGLRSYRW